MLVSAALATALCVAAAAAVALVALYVVYRVRGRDALVTSVALLDAAEGMQGRRVYSYTEAPGVAVKPERVPSSAIGEGYTVSGWVLLEAPAPPADIFDFGVQTSDAYWLVSRGPAQDPSLVLALVPGTNEVYAAIKTTGGLRRPWPKVAELVGAVDKQFLADLWGTMVAAGAASKQSQPPSTMQLVMQAVGQGIASLDANGQLDMLRALDALGKAASERLDAIEKESGWLFVGISYVPVSRWVHIGVSTDGAVVRLFLDGDLYTKASLQGSVDAQTAARLGLANQAVTTAGSRGGGVAFGCTSGARSRLLATATNWRIRGTVATRREMADEYAAGPRGGSVLGAIGLPAYGFRWPLERAR